MIAHGGERRRMAQRFGDDPEAWLDLSTGINPWAWPDPAPLPGPPPEAWQRLPETEDGLEAAARAYYGTEHLLAVPGSQAAIAVLPFLRGPSRVTILSPTYGEHAAAWQRAGHAVQRVSAAAIQAGPSVSSRRWDVLIVTNPNNPTGERFDPDCLARWHADLATRGGWLIVDEAFADLTPTDSTADRTSQSGWIVLRSFGKFFGLAGARVGFVLAEPGLRQRLAEQIGPWPVAGPSRWLARQALADTAWQAQMRARLSAARERLNGVLTRHGLEPAGGTDLFRWVNHESPMACAEALAGHRILVRTFQYPLGLRFGFPGAARDWERLDAALEAARDDPASRPAAPARARASAPPTPTLMIQGTQSDAGKSTLVAGLGRALRRRGVDVAPFKPQNMALNSAVTPTGGEIGRAQAVQARACGLDATPDMNPVLIKPNTETGAQVIVDGRAIGNREARDFSAYRQEVRGAVFAAYERLAAGHECILVEGAGSPAEVNLRAHDIANMGFAEAVDCPVVLVGDIDRGGVFAQLVGTVSVLAPSEQARIRGLVINRFRGEQALLQPGLDWLEDRLARPVLGVLPYLTDLHLEAEDAVDPRQVSKGSLRVRVPVTPRLSNHTDFDPLRLHPQVDLRYVRAGEALEPADLIILGGSKSVIADLAWLRAQGFDEAIHRHLAEGGRVLGICGGWQMLGDTLEDPDGLEGPAGTAEGLGLLEVTTRLAPEKILGQVEGRLTVAGEPVAVGYEIHAGATQGRACQRPLIQRGDGLHDGARSPDDRVMGTYLHGLFEGPEAIAALLHWAGLSQPDTGFDYRQERDRALDRLADAIDAHLDVDRLLGIARGG